MFSTFYAKKFCINIGHWVTNISKSWCADVVSQTLRFRKPHHFTFTGNEDSDLLAVLLCEFSTLHKTNRKCSAYCTKLYRILQNSLARISWAWTKYSHWEYDVIKSWWWYSASENSRVNAWDARVKCSGKPWLIPWLLMPWILVSLGH